jgi:DNA replication and repair protein RecF
MDLVAGTPEKRRKFMDLLISRINPGYLYNILNYHKVLKEKNRILFSKKQDRILIDTFNEQLVNIGSVIIKKRLDFLQEFSSLLEKLLGAIFGINKNIGLKYLSSVNIGNKDISLEYISEKFRNKIKKLAEAEFLYKKTLTGPHRDDVLFLLNNGNVRYFASSGEQLAFGLSSRLCEAIILSKDKDNPPLLILDDCLSFLDEKKQLAFWDLIRNKGQIIFASTKIPSFLSENENFSFRIDNGEIVNV